MNTKKHFPFFKHNPNITYLNNAATTHKPHAMIAARSKFLAKNKNKSIETIYQNIQKALFTCKKMLAEHLNCLPSEVFFFSQGTTKIINLVAQCLKKKQAPGKDMIISSELEHHSNYVPWLAHFDKVKILKLDQMAMSLEKPTDLDLSQVLLLTLTAHSNVLGQVWQKDYSDLKDRILEAHTHGALVLLDGAQALEDSIDLKYLDPDIFVFSAHKFYGPTNLGIAIVKTKIQPIFCFSQEINSLPGLEIVEFLATLKFLKQKRVLKAKKQQKNYTRLSKELLSFLQSFSEVHILKTKHFATNQKIISFYVDKIHSHDIADLLAQDGIIVRAGNHCAKPMHDALFITNSMRISLACYNNLKDITNFKKAFKKALSFLQDTCL